MNKAPKEILHALITSYDYNRDEVYMIGVLQEVQKRLKKYRTVWTDEGNIIVGTLILLYGDYGTSPRGGWFDDREAEKEILESIAQEIEQFKVNIQVRVDCEPEEMTEKYNPERLKELEQIGIKIPPTK